MNIKQYAHILLSSWLIIGLIPASQGATAKDDVLTWGGCGITKKAFMAELAKAYEQKTGVKIVLQGGGATRGIRETTNMHLDLGGSCRMNLPEEDRTEFHANLHPVAWDALVLITNKQNPIKNLNADQVRDIYLGKITDWRQVGGAPGRIHLYVRRGKISGVGYTIRQYLFKDSNIDFVTKSEYVKPSSGPLEKAVEKDANALAITGVSSARKRNVKIINMDNKSPTYDNVMHGKYVLYRPLYLVTTPSPSPRVKDFVAFATSKEGRDIIRANGTVPYRDAPNLMSKMLIYGFDVR